MPARQPADRSPDDRRGQTGLDFVIGIGVFLVTVAFVFGFVPGMLDPFTDDRAHQVVADRAADAVIDDLAANREPGVLDEACTVELFNRTGAASCPFDPGDSLAEQVGAADRYKLNVSLGRSVAGAPGPDVLCYDGREVQSCDDGGTAAVVGDPLPPDRKTVVTATRSVLVDGRSAVLVVRVWS